MFFGCFDGEEGPVGPQGEQGEQGLRGRDGSNGNSGRAGDDGLTLFQPQLDSVGNLLVNSYKGVYEGVVAYYKKKNFSSTFRDSIRYDTLFLNLTSNQIYQIGNLSDGRVDDTGVFTITNTKNIDYISLINTVGSSNMYLINMLDSLHPKFNSEKQGFVVSGLNEKYFLFPSYRSFTSDSLDKSIYFYER